MPKEEIVYIGLGGNMGDVAQSMKAVLSALNAHPNIRVSRVSRIYKTPPWGVEDQNWFLNSCAELTTTLSAEELLVFCLDIEKSLKRERNLRWGPRTIDVDILYFGNVTIEEESLTIPHPRMHERLFVMKPLSDIAPELAIKGNTVQAWVTSLEETPLEVQIDDNWWN